MPLKVRVQNFQSIEDATIVIDGLTSLTGTNNSGKSAMFRAIRGAFTNTRGFSFVRLGTTHATVDIEDLVTGHTLTWEKGSKINRYTINGKKVDRVGHGVPPEVSDLFGVRPIQAGGSDLWPQIAPQMNGVMFLLDQPGSVIAEAVADVARVNQLNAALKMAESDRKSAKTDLKIRQKDALNLQERREGFQGLEEALLAVEKLSQVREKAEKLVVAHKNLGRLGERHKAAKESLEALSGVSFLQVPSDEKITRLRDLRKGVADITILASRLKAARASYELAEKSAEVLGQVGVDQDLDTKALRVKEVLTRTVSYREQLTQTKDLLGKIAEAIRQREVELEEIGGKAAEVLGSYTDCPTCGGQLDHLHATE